MDAAVPKYLGHFNFTGVVGRDDLQGFIEFPADLWVGCQHLEGG